MDRPAVTRRRVAVLIAVVVSFVGVVSVSPVAAGAPPVFSGTVDEFYVVPNPLPPGAPGDLIRVQAVSQTATATTVRIMYHSRDALLRDRAVTGMLTYPNAAPPAGGWPVLSWANGTVGMASQCALSRAGRAVSTLGIAGVGVQSDYVGLGPVGEIHPYLSRPSEGFSVIDAVRAARNLPESGAGARWMAIGVSQGGHGAISANELGEQHAPELDLLGTVALAPARDVRACVRRHRRVRHPCRRRDGALRRGDRASRDRSERLRDARRGAGVASVIRTGCLDQITAAFLAIPLDGFYAHDPAVTQPAQALATANDVGRVRVDAPLFLVQGTADTTVVPQRTRDLFARLCSHGQVTKYLEVAGAGHGDVLARSLPEIQSWFADRLAGRPAATSCTPPVAPPTVVPGAGSVTEGDAGTTSLAVPLSLSWPTDETVTVQWHTVAVPGIAFPHADPTSDYIAGSGTATFAPGQTSTTVSITVRGDAQPEPDELLVVSFGNPTHARMGGFWGLGFGSVVDDD